MNSAMIIYKNIINSDRRYIIHISNIVRLLIEIRITHTSVCLVIMFSKKPRGVCGSPKFKFYKLAHYIAECLMHSSQFIQIDGTAHGTISYTVCKFMSNNINTLITMVSLTCTECRPAYITSHVAGIINRIMICINKINAKKYRHSKTVDRSYTDACKVIINPYIVIKGYQVFIIPALIIICGNTINSEIVIFKIPPVCTHYLSFFISKIVFTILRVITDRNSYLLLMTVNVCNITCP